MEYNFQESVHLLIFHSTLSSTNTRDISDNRGKGFQNLTAKKFYIENC